MTSLRDLRSLPYLEKWLIMGVILGIVAGLSSLTFYFAIRGVEYFLLESVIGLTVPRPLGEGGSLIFQFHATRYYLIPFVVAAGGAISGLLVYSLAPEAEGHGTDAAISAYHYREGKVRWRVIPIKLIASAFTIGSGGSAGREGPTAQLSAGIGSMIADLMGLTPEDRRRAVAVGIGAGIGTIFKTPIGGAILAAEILYKRDLEPDVIFPALVASAVGYSIFGSIVGFTPIFGNYTGSFDPIRLPLYAILGLIAGLMGLFYIKTFYGVHDTFKRVRLSPYLKPVIGGLLTGTIALLAPEVMATGYGWINLLEYEKFTEFYSLLPVLYLLVLLPFIKVLATSLTIGSGGSGGVFAPGMFIGAFVGGDVGLLFHFLFPQLVPSIAPFVIIGMVSMFGGAAKAPLSVLIMVTEMTGSLQLLPGAMIAVAISYLVTGNQSIYRSQVPTRRESPAHASEYEQALLAKIKVAQCKLRDIKVSAISPVEETISIMMRNNFFSIPVVDNDDNFLGVAYMRDILGKSGDVGKFVVRGVQTVMRQSSLEEALETMSRTKARWAPVVEKGKLLGVLIMEDAMEVYREELVKLKVGERMSEG
ncbi:chloride channel protein EriC [Metallosphaera yellowstonensis MK1]|uniref:Chloride channel protein EriC n=1 Tax=Metallosphaera yellowstonensis MK1 TaxID=671065 RepID=H2C4Y0_9CREN|nr:chloride channel protein [Metallosphaera yellowstonensis]EHP71071.1 chloride channel protein EriC [Metallosphaera yellowstonensis MK1]